MTFAEADAQYEVVKQQYLSGALADEQFDEQLRRLMVLDAAGAWWAKSRENGVWHYFDAATGNWVAATPPTAPAPPPPPRTRETGPTPLPAAAPGAASTAHQGSTSSAASDAAQGSTSGATGGATSLPKWAAVKPGAPTPTAGAPRAISGPAAGASGASGAPGAATRSTASLPGTAQGAPATGGYHPRDFGPIAELTGSMKVLFYVLSLFLPFLGLILYFVYRHKPAEADRAAARVFLILGIASLVFTFMCGATFFLLESPLLGAGT
jgi:hypothetical protein